MARNTGSGRGVNAGIAFMVGALLVVLALVTVLVIERGLTERKPVDLKVDLPKMEAPKLPPVEPPTVPTPSPATSNGRAI